MPRYYLGMEQQYNAPLKANGKAIAAMVLGIVSIPTCFCYGIVSIICGGLGLIFAIMAKKEIEAGGFTSGSRGMNTAGLVCSIIGLLLGLGYIIILIIAIAAGAAMEPTTY